MAKYLGFDPGGLTGAALLTVEEEQFRCAVKCVESVSEAFEWATEELGGLQPEAAGLDTFLFWEATPHGWRAADRWLRNHYPEVRASVLPSNSTAGSMAVQGMALAIVLRKRWPQIELVETHPKVLYYALANRKYEWPSDMRTWLVTLMKCSSPEEIDNDHCWDAALSAWAAYQGHAGRWKRDLRSLSSDVIEPAGRCSYWWPS